MRTLRNIAALLTSTLILVWFSSVQLHAQDTPGQLYEKALIAEEVQGDLSTAITLYQQVLNQNPDNREMAAQALLHMGMCYEKQGSEQARQAYRDIINKYADQEEEAALATQRIKHLEAQVAELNIRAQQHMKQGNELFKLWEYEDAIKEYENAIKLRPETLLAMNAQYCIGQSLYRAGDYDAAMATFTNLLEENPQSTIAPVTELMVSQVQHAMETNKIRTNARFNADENSILDPNTGITYQKIKTFAGQNDQIGFLSGGWNMSPDCRFMVLENKVVPMDGSIPFNLVEMPALRAIYAPDMKKAAFFADSAIWTVPVSPETGRTTGQPSRLLDGGYKFEPPVNWSPDGQRIAITRDEKDIEPDIWTISVNGGALQRITHSPDIEHSPCWSSDGSTIAYRKGPELWQASTNGENHSMILKRSGGAPFCWSSDKKWLILKRRWDNPYLYSFELDKKFELTPPEHVGTFVSFSPEGNKLLFYRSSHDAKWPLKIVSSSGGASYKPAGNTAAYGSTWMGDSKHIMVQGEDEQGNIGMNIISLGDEDPMNIKIEADVEGEPFPYYMLPDYKHIAFSVEKDNGRHDLYIAPFSAKEAKTTGPALMIFKDWSGGAYNVTTSWSPDGKKLALCHEGNIWMIPVDTGIPVQITNTPEEERWINWSPDGQWISYKTLNLAKKTETLHVIQPGADSSRVLHRNCYRETIWNHYSKTILLFSEGVLQEISLDGTVLEQILSLKDLEIEVFDSPCLSPDGKHLAFVGYESYESGESSIIIKYSFENKKITRLALDDVHDYKYSISWSPDGKWISFLTYEELKVRPEGYLWEADFNEVIEKLTAQE